MKKNKLWHTLFLVGILFKGLDGVLELVGGILFLLIKQDSIANYTTLLFRQELVEDPNDIIANYLIHLTSHISVNTELFAAIYMLVHGIIKVSIVSGLYLRKLWIYPAAELVLTIFVIYQIYRFSHTFSILLIFLTIIDIFIIVLIRSEYKRLTSLLGSESS